MRKKIGTFHIQIFALVIFMGGHILVEAQIPVDSLVRKFDKYRRNALQEKLYVHTSQEFYLTGELMWFKIYYVDGTLHKPLQISQLAYVEVLDKNNTPVLQTKVGLKDNSGDGSLFLPVTLLSGTYTFRAYTNWMKNFSPEFYFQKTITIVNPFSKIETTQNKMISSWDAQFFPEGGNLVDQLQSKVGFRVTDESGHGIDFHGSVINNRNDTITRFDPLTFGIGHFVFTPEHGEQYRAVIDDRKGHKKIFTLPAILPAGYVINLKNEGNQISLQVKSNLTPSPDVPAVYLFIHSRGIISRAKMNLLQSGETQFVVDKKDLQDGISQITLFDGALQPVCERLYYKTVQEKLSVTIQSASEYSMREKVNLELTTTRKNAQLSISVFKEDSIQNPDPADIHNYLWMTSDLQGTVESPQYYSKTELPEVNEALDNIMLTHGWRRFKWAEVLKAGTPDIKFVPEYRGHLISGTLFAIKDSVINYEGEDRGRRVRGKLMAERDSIAPGIGTYLSTPGKNIELYPSMSDSNSEVRYEVADFYGSTKVIAHAQSLHGEPYKFVLKSPFSANFSEARIPEFQLSPLIARQILSRTVGMQVQNTFRDEDKDHYMKETRDSVAFFGTPDEVYLLDDYTRFPVMEEVMREYIKGVWVRKNKEGFRFMIFDRLNEVLMRDNPLMLLDGVPFQDPDNIMNYDAAKVKKIETFRKKFYLGPIPFQGVISFTTYNKDAEGFTLEADNLELNYEGLQSRREFYSPQYDSRRLRESRLPDRRYQLFWNPQIITDAEGKGHVEFYASDLTGNFRIVIQGITKQGEAGSSSAVFNVKK